jgi:uncharacterized membrane protein (DUF4010 family)
LIDFGWPPHLRFFLAVALSFLVGLERESAALLNKGQVFAGVRTFTLIGMFGFGCGWVAQNSVPWVLPAGMLVVGALALAGYLAKLKEGFFGWTTEVAAITTFIMGYLCLTADIWVPMALGIIITFLLSEKAQLENFVARLDQMEFLAVVRFLIVTVIILPVLPNQEYTQFSLNPRRIWQLVILVSAIGFVGYFLAKRFGDRIGLWLSGLLGGIVSSTAVSVAAGRIARRTPERRTRALQASLIASSVMYLRILVLVWLINPAYAAQMWIKLSILAAIGFGLCLITRSTGAEQTKQGVETLSNPFELRPALVFASLFVLLSVVTVLTTKFYGDAGLLVLSGIIGVTDIDPFILSLVNSSTTLQHVTVTAILISMMSNTIVKGIYFAVLAPKPRLGTVWRFGVWAVLHVPVILIG